MAQDLNENTIKWIDRNKSIITIDNCKYKLIVTTWKAIYPYKRTVISIQAEMINKRSKYYLKVKRAFKQ